MVKLFGLWVSNALVWRNGLFTVPCLVLVIYLLTHVYACLCGDIIGFSGVGVGLCWMQK